MSNPSYSPNYYSQSIHIRKCLENAFDFFKRWRVTLENDFYPRMLYEKYRKQVTLMAKEAGIDTRTYEEKRKENINKAKDKTIEVILKILGIILVAFIMSLIFNGWEGTFR